MKKLIIVLLVLVTNVYSQSSFYPEWESPTNRHFLGITSVEQGNTIPEIILRGSSYQTVNVYDGATKQIKYTFTDPDTTEISTFSTIKNQPLDVNNDGKFEIISERKYNFQYIGGPDIYYKLKIINAADGQILFQVTYTGYTGELQTIDIDGDGYTELCISLYGNYRKLIIISTTSNYVGINNQNSKIENYELKQNYPNPFNPETKIEYTIPYTADVRLVIFDIMGKEISSLVNEKQNAGTYIKNLNGANLSSGTYFYQLTVNGVPESKKMILIK